jgi:5'-nucleotidase
MHILVTNDDGVQSPGLLAMAKELAALGKVTIFAPDRNWSASGHAKTLDRPIRVNEVPLKDGTPAWSCDGAPADCVALPLMGFIEETIDIVVAGINPNANIGTDITYSGTVTAAMEAVITGMIPGIAVSLDAPEYHTGPLDFSAAAKVVRIVTKKAMSEQLPKGVFLNINVPYMPFEQIKGFIITRLGTRVYRDKLDRRLDPRGRPYYWIGGEPPTGIIEEGTDFGALKAGFVSITPLLLDMTDHKTLQDLRTWKWNC